jgi:tail protein X
MKFTIVKNKSNLTQLTHDVFEIKGSGAKAREKEIEASLLAANPHLADLKHIPEGTPIIIPEIAVEAQVKDSASTTPTLVQQIRGQLDGLRKSLEEIRAREVAELKQTRQILKTKDFKAAVGDKGTARTRLDKIDKEATDRLTALDQLKKSQEKGFNQLGKDLDNFITRFF